MLMVFLWFPIAIATTVFPWFSYGSSKPYLWLSYGFLSVPMIFPLVSYIWFSDGFPVDSYGCPLVFCGFLWLSLGFPMVSYGFPLVSYLLQSLGLLVCWSPDLLVFWYLRYTLLERL